VIERITSKMADRGFVAPARSRLAEELEEYKAVRRTPR
jgi:hypothetical protein